MGSDFFTYRMLVGSILTQPVTVAIKVVDPSNPTTTTPAAATPSSVTLRPGAQEREGREERDLEIGSKSRSPVRGAATPLRKKKSQTKSMANSEADEKDINLEMLYTAEEKVGFSRPTKRAHDPNAQTPFLQNLLKKTSLHMGTDDKAEQA